MDDRPQTGDGFLSGCGLSSVVRGPLSDMSIHLEFFTEADIDQLIGWVPTRAFLLQWAGPSFDFPLTPAQLQELLDASNTPDAAFRLFKAVTAEGEVIGHCELPAIDRENGSATLGRVLIGRPEYRGRGYGTAMVRAALDVAFKELGLHRVGLGVFDFNGSAIACYEAVRFRHEGTFRDYPRNDGAYWSLRMMSILEDEYRANAGLPNA